MGQSPPPSRRSVPSSSRSGPPSGRPGSPSRRAFLRTGVLSTTAALSGCLFGIRDVRSRPEQLDVSVDNNTEASHSFRIRLFEGAGTAAAGAGSTAAEAESTAAETEAPAFEGSFYLKAGEEETRSSDLTGTEYRVLGSVDREWVLEGEWHWAGCRTDEVAITFWSPTEGGATGVCSQD